MHAGLRFQSCIDHRKRNPLGSNRQNWYCAAIDTGHLKIKNSCNFIAFEAFSTWYCAAINTGHPRIRNSCTESSIAIDHAEELPRSFPSIENAMDWIPPQCSRFCDR